MLNSEMVKMIVELQKKGVRVHLTDDGYKEFLRLMQEHNTSNTIAG